MFSEAEMEDRKKYLRNLVANCSLSSIHSDSKKPYLEYRVAENIFCEAFHAQNVSRQDIAIDAVLGKLGIGIKTFVDGTAYQKIAEFDKHTDYSKIFDDLAIVKNIAKKRNHRLDEAIKKHNLDELIYHYTVRYDGSISVFECPMHHIDVDSIKYVSRTENTIHFNDKLKNYKFSISKSTLYMEFDVSNPLINLQVKNLTDASESILDLYEKRYGKILLDPADDNEYEEPEFSETVPDNPYIDDSVILPLFSTKKIDGKPTRYVPERSGVNQWNANGRTRHPCEVYVPVPSYIHKNHPGFFPPNTETFSLELPGGRILSAKLCQSGDKGLMSNPNKDLGEWLLKNVFEQKDGELITYEMMEYIRVNAVRVTKLKTGHYYMNFIYVPQGYKLGKTTQFSSSR